MKTRRMAVFFISLVICAGLVSGCAEDEPEADVTRSSEAEAEEYAEAEEDEEYDENLEFDDIPDFEDDLSDDGEGAETATSAINGYYGFWNGDTEYIFGALSEKDFMINIVGASGPVLYAEGEYDDHGDGFITAAIKDAEQDFAKEKILKISTGADTEKRRHCIWVGSDDQKLNDIVEGKYLYAGKNASDVEKLKDMDDSGNVTRNASEGGGSVLCFSGKDVDGNPVDTSEVFAKNKVTMVNLWASWCGPCAGEIPELEKMNEDLKDKDCAVVGILMDGADPECLRDGRDVLSDAQATYLNVIAPVTLGDDVGLEGYPTTYFVDANGNILGDPIIGADLQEYQRTLEKLLSE